MTVNSAAPGKLARLTVLHFIPTLEGGGAERQLSLLATEQVRRGFDVHVAVRRGGEHAQRMRDGGVKFHELGDIRSVRPRLFMAMRRVVGKIRPDIVQTWLPQMDILGGVLALASRIPWILSERTSGNYYKQIPAIARLRLLLGRFASAVISNSEGGTRYWRQAAPRSLKLATIRNAVDIERIQGVLTQVAREPSPNPLLLVVGRFSHEKAHETIVRSLIPVCGERSVDVLMIGEGSERSRIESEIETASLSKRVMLLPYQSDWWRWLKVADGLISMSRYEGNPNVVLEAMAGGCPVILSDISAHREIADSSFAIFVPVDDVPALSASISALLADKDAASRRAEKALDRTKSMSVGAMADAYEAVYEEALGRELCAASLA
ncbi:glycosyltransferase involved in cell wall biosynthesis [Bradyrhizobium sp. JR1.5]|uniref:glycosyltransferase n=1 Tax=unclassified Bradyrhizobium TaxID=2631580 RepID=UPI00339ADCD3